MAAIGKAKKRKYTRRIGADKPHERETIKPLKKISNRNKNKSKFVKQETFPTVSQKPKRKYVHKSGFDSITYKGEEPKRKYVKKIANPPEKSKRVYIKHTSGIPKDVFFKHIKKTKFYKDYQKLMSANGKAMKFMIALNDLNLKFISEFVKGE